MMYLRGQQPALLVQDVRKLQQLLNQQASMYGSIGSNYMVQHPSPQTRHFRSECACRIRSLHYFYGGSPGTFAVAIATADFFLWRAKVSEKHLSCLSAACYLIASKLMEDEVSPGYPSGSGMIVAPGWELHTNLVRNAHQKLMLLSITPEIISTLSNWTGQVSDEANTQKTLSAGYGQGVTLKQPRTLSDTRFPVGNRVSESLPQSHEKVETFDKLFRNLFQSPVSVSELRMLHFNQWTEADLRRMEKWVLRQLSWHVPMSTYLPFLQLFSQIVSRCASGQSLSVGFLVKKAEDCLMEESSIVMKPSSLALGVVQHCLQASPHNNVTITTTVLTLQNMLQVCDSELYECSCILNHKESQKATSRSTVHKPAFPLKIRYRPAWEGSTDLQTISEEFDSTDEGDATNANFFKISEESLELDNRSSHNIRSFSSPLERRGSSDDDADECESDMSDSTSDSEANESGDALSDSSFGRAVELEVGV